MNIRVCLTAQRSPMSQVSTVHLWFDNCSQDGLLLSVLYNIPSFLTGIPRIVIPTHLKKRKKKEQVGKESYHHNITKFILVYWNQLHLQVFLWKVLARELTIYINWRWEYAAYIFLSKYIKLISKNLILKFSLKQINVFL